MKHRKHHARHLTATCGIALLLVAACGDDDGTNAGDAGADGGPDAAQSCDEARAGKQGCQCAEGDRCGNGANGEMLMCVGGVCESASCVSGDRGCVCRYGTECAMEGDLCDRGFCRPADCVPGAEFCPCLGGTCDTGLICQNGTLCLDGTGYEGGPCKSNNTCERGNRCDPVQDLCVHCELGSAGCQCTAAGTCGDGLACAGGHCVDGSVLPPDDPKCYTPCRTDLTVDDEVRICDSDGLLAGCLDGLECTEGSCLKPGESKPSCDDDLDCPFFQTCLQGGCYSNCEVDADCNAGLGCHIKVCRVPCDAASGKAACPSDATCDAPDGEHGFCVPMGDVASKPATLPSGGFSLNDRVLQFSNVETTKEFMLLAAGASSQEVTIRKLSHKVYFEDGTFEEVIARKDPKTREYVECDAARGECPLFWLQLSDGDQETMSPTLSVKVPGNCDAMTCPTITVSGAGSGPGVRYEGSIELCSTNGCSEPLVVTYTERPEGQWSGTLYYFGTFSDVGLADWVASSDKGNASNVDNGLIRQWASFRDGRLDGWQEFLAILTSTQEGSWDFANVKSKCRTLNNGATAAACYPFTNTQGVRNYVQNESTTPIPTGVVGFPVAFNLKVKEPGVLEGRIASETALQYAANPKVTLGFADDPADADACSSSVSSDCAVFVESFTAQIDVGGRYYAGDATCASGYGSSRTPWLVEGFHHGTALDPATNLRYRYECRDSELPYDPAGGSDATALNRSLAGANPIPDGRERTRTLRLLDGALVNQSELFILFQEEFDTFIPGDPPVSAYGYMILRKTPTDVAPEEFVGNSAPDTTKAQPERMGVMCSQDILDKTAVAADATMLETLPSDDLDAIVNELIDGPDVGDPNSGYTLIPAAEMHVLCEETGLIDGGHENDGVNANPALVACPAWSKLTYLHIDPAVRDQAAIAALPCNELPTTPGAEDVGIVDSAGKPIDVTTTDDDSCNPVVERWIENGLVREVNPLQRCADADKVFCDDPKRLDLLDGKEFYTLAGTATPRLQPVLGAINQAFRYKVRFRSSSGGQLGFAPRICLPNSDQVPYCYDPEAIEEIRDRFNCLIDIYTNYAATLSAPVATKLNGFLRQSFSSFKDPVTNAFLHEGFERLYAELLIMQGDDALTAAFASRFDLAAVGGAPFEGSLFEPNGIDLTGVAGFEMVKLHQAIQYYQLALDRLYAMGPNYAAALGQSGATTDDDSVFVSPATVTDYLERLTRAATQKARAWGEVAKRYQSFNRPDLARAVIERAYTGTYLESALISNLMIEIKRKSNDKSLDQIRLEIEKAQLRYRMALLDMRDIYETITDSITYFGFPADYVPFPALDAGNIRDTNGYEVLAAIARQKVELARLREIAALESNRTQKTDAATFQAELVRVRNTYENQLSDICGTFYAPDGTVYPAIRKYAHLSEEATLFGDPCGRMGNGQLHEAIAGVQAASLALRASRLRWTNVIDEIEIEQQRVAEQCDLIDEVAQIQFESATKVRDLQEEIGESRNRMNFIQREADAVTTSIQMMICEPPTVGVSASIGTCPTAIPAALASLAIATAANVTMSIHEQDILDKELDIADAQAETAKLVTESQCDAAEIDSIAKVKTLRLGMKEAELEAMRADHQVRLQLAEVQQLVNSAERWLSQQAEAEQLLIDVEAARNDPNIRIYRNDAVLNADIAFDDAMRAVYRTTRVFEYYTSQSYAKRDQLFLIRMVTAGEYNLENYLNELENSFFDFEETFGVPDTRVAVLSLRDDILQIPLIDEQGNPYSQGQRIDMMRERLKDVSLLDSNGYFTIPFGTSLDQISPLTRNHKVRYVEVDIVGSDVGDTVGRVYLRSAGTGVVHNLNDEIDYYVFPERVGVINTFFNGNRVFEPDVYRNFRLRDRPLVNTLWEFVINQRDERVNADIDLQSLSDIRLLMFYTDFTGF